MNQPFRVSVHRGGFWESEHLVDAVVLDGAGAVVAQWGDPHKLIFTRSASKFLQALLMVHSGAAKGHALSLRELSLACASHHGEIMHTSTVAAWLQKLDLSESNLVCGAHEPYHDGTRRQLIREGQGPSRLHNNCSGKHSGLLTACKWLGFATADYQAYGHPLQVQLRDLLTTLTSVPHDKLPWGIDGCGIPNYALPLAGFADGLRVFLPDVKGELARYRESAATLRHALESFPEMISGSQGLCSRVIQYSRGQVLAKVGAEGVYAGILPHSGLVFALKAHDGSERAASAAMLTFAKKYAQGAFSESQQIELEGLIPVRLKNWAGESVGEIKVNI